MGSGRVCVVGLGYVGLPTAAVLASRGVEVIGVDIDSARVERVNFGVDRRLMSRGWILSLPKLWHPAD